MMFYFILLAALGVIVAGSPRAQDVIVSEKTVEVFCKVNEVYRECGGCDQYCNREPVFCTQDCRSPGCYCQNGYVRSFKGGICIPPKSCPAPVQSPVGEYCKVNEVYNECGGCDQYCNSEPVFCTQDCSRPGCYCQTGYVRSCKGGICIPERTCPRVQNDGPYPVQSAGPRPQGPPQCPLNEVYNSCGGCDQYCNSEPIACAQDCSRPGCYCQRGYVRSFRGGICIPRNSCPRPQGPTPVQNPGPPQCQINEVYNSCGGCDQYCNSEPIFCTAACDRPGCYCQSGFVRSFKGGICIPRKDCPCSQGKNLTCGGLNEEYACGSACQTTCRNLGKPCPIVNIKCNDSCYCKKGFARDMNGICIDQNEC